jgi:hypothetical protein
LYTLYGNLVFAHVLAHVVVVVDDVDNVALLVCMMQSVDKRYVGCTNGSVNSTREKQVSSLPMTFWQFQRYVVGSRCIELHRAPCIDELRCIGLGLDTMCDVQLVMNPLGTRIIALFDTEETEEVNFRQFVMTLSAFHPMASIEERLRGTPFLMLFLLIAISLSPHSQYSFD